MTGSEITGQEMRASSRAARAVALLALWSVVGLVFATEEFIAVHAFGGSVSLRRTLGYALPAWYLWELFTPFILYLARRYPIRRSEMTFALLFHTTAGAIISLVHTAAVTAVLAWTNPALLNGQPYRAALGMRIQFASHLDIVTYWAVVGIAHAIAFYRRQTESELQSVRLSASLAEARLQVLRMELNPHFLFNTLNAISAFVYSDPRAADRMIARLGELLRLSLASRSQVTVSEELRLLQCYIDIEQVRFGDRLQVAISAENGAGAAIVPTLILQPLVENALRHGYAGGSAEARVSVRAATDGRRLEITVEDEGAGMSTTRDGVGVGLSNSRARLSGLYGDRASLDISPRPGGGTVVRIALPFVGQDV